MLPTTSRHERATSPALPRSVRVLASLAILTYLAGLISAPLSGPPPASDLSQVILQPFRPLLGALYLGHGYRFFAPDPGPGHSLRWTITRADGTTLSGTTPDAAQDWPRLLYHRRFMVAEKIAPLVPPPDAPAEVRARSKADWLPLVKGVAGNLLRTHRGDRITLAMVEHYLPAPEEVAAGRTEADLVMPLGTFARGESLGQAGGSRKAANASPSAEPGSSPR